MFNSMIIPPKILSTLVGVLRLKANSRQYLCFSWSLLTHILRFYNHSAHQNQYVAQPDGSHGDKLMSFSPAWVTFAKKVNVCVLRVGGPGL